VREEIDEENEAVLTWEPRVEVDTLVVRVVEVLYAKPDCVASLPPVDVIDAFSVAEVLVIEEAEAVVTVGARQAEVRKVEFPPNEVPPELVAYECTLYVVLQVRPVAEPVYAPVEKEPDSVVVAPYEVVRPYAKPRVLGLAPPVAVMFPLSVALEFVREEADW
jgi:hypothetical protein